MITSKMLKKCHLKKRKEKQGKMGARYMCLFVNKGFVETLMFLDL